MFRFSQVIRDPPPSRPPPPPPVIVSTPLTVFFKAIFSFSKDFISLKGRFDFFTTRCHFGSKSSEKIQFWANTEGA